MASGPLRAEASSRPLCRNFARGSCRWGQSCRFSHDRKSAQVCRYFQRGVCPYGEHCSYQHIQEEPAPAGTQHDVTPRRHQGQEPDTEPTAMDRDRGGAQGTSVHPASSMTCVTIPFLKLVAEEEEKDKKNIPAPDNVPCGAISGEAQDASGFQPQGPAAAPDSSDPRKAVLETATQTNPAKVPAGWGAVATLVFTNSAVLRARSEDVVCGICMDRVYEKALPRERLFGILPNCSHAYCLGCIRKWRRSRNFQRAVVRACPECRITSSYYIPHKYWISDVDEKRELIRTFKARTGKIRCKYFIHGRCPFRSECIYLHEPPARQPPARQPPARQPPARQPRRRRRQRQRTPAVFIPSSSESSDEEDEELEWARTLAMLQEEFPCRPSAREIFEMFLFDVINSD